VDSVRLPRTNLTVTRFTFGTASLHHLGSAKAQAAHAAASIEAGFTHFDTAPLYGFGSAERVLGTVLAGSPELTVTTKVGLYPPGASEPSRAAITLRKAAGRIWPAMSRAIADLSVDRARASLEGSLQRLRRHRIELLLIHEPNAALLNTDEWLRWVEEERGRVHHFGIAGPQEIVQPFLRMANPLTAVIQTRDSLDGCEADIVSNAGRPLQLTYGYFTATSKALSGNDILTGALARNPAGSVVVSTRSPARLAQFAKIAKSPTQAPS